MSEEKKEWIDFECRICGGKKFTASYSGNDIIGPGYRSWITGYSCDGCSVEFKNPFTFSKKGRRKKPKPSR